MNSRGCVFQPPSGSALRRSAPSARRRGCRDERVLLETLERRVRIEQRILVVEADDEPDRDAAVGHGVEPAAAELLLPQRIAERVDDRPRLQPILGDVPELLDADRKLRRLAGRPSCRTRISSLVRCPRTPSAKIVTLAGCPRRARTCPRLAVLAHAAIARPHADHALAVEQHRLPGKPQNRSMPSASTCPPATS